METIFTSILHWASLPQILSGMLNEILKVSFLKPLCFVFCAQVIRDKKGKVLAITLVILGLKSQAAPWWRHCLGPGTDLETWYSCVRFFSSLKEKVIDALERLLYLQSFKELLTIQYFLITSNINWRLQSCIHAFLLYMNIVVHEYVTHRWVSVTWFTHKVRQSRQACNIISCFLSLSVYVCLPRSFLHCWPSSAAVHRDAAVAEIPLFLAASWK